MKLNIGKHYENGEFSNNGKWGREIYAQKYLLK
jgi:hypothetical protein